MKRRTEFLLHLLYWTSISTLSVLQLLPVLEQKGEAGNLWISMGISQLLDLFTFYLFYLIISPRTLFKRQIILFLTISIFYIAGFGFVWGKTFELAGLVQSREEIYWIWLRSLTHSFLHISLGALFRFAIDWLRNQHRQKEIERQHAATELALLRSKVNPHFLFNTLNNIHAFIHTTPDRAASAVIKLSEIMRYMLYEATTEKVLLEKEIQYLNNYLDLQRLRLKSPENVEFAVTGNPSNLLIAPMLFIPFMENAFKHGRKNEQGAIQFKLDITDKLLVFKSKNTIKTLNISPSNHKDKGFGLKNVRKRLQIIYPRQHELNIETNGTTFFVQLTLQINEN